MSYYVTILERGNPRRVCFAAGPFNRHGDALAAVPHVERVAAKIDRDHHWHTYGTAHDKRGRARDGKLNDRLRDVADLPNGEPNR